MYQDAAILPVCPDSFSGMQGLLTGVTCEALARRAAPLLLIFLTFTFSELNESLIPQQYESGIIFPKVRVERKNGELRREMMP